MKKSKYKATWYNVSVTMVFLIFTVLFFLGEVRSAHSFIQREFTLQEILDACTNVAFGNVESVDKQKQRAIVKLGEDIKGKSPLSHVRINVAVGQRTKQTSPEMLIEKFKVRLPVIIFYQKVDSKLNGLGYVSGTWFQIFGNDNEDKSRIWWNFSHIEIYMHRTYEGSTEDFQKVVRKAVSGEKWPDAGKDDIKVLVLTGNGAPPLPGDEFSVGTARTTAEFMMLRTFNKVGNWRIAYQDTRDRNLSDLHEAQILWIGVDELSKDGYQLNKKAEERIKSFVRRGGIVIVSSQDSDPPGKICGSGWISEAIKGVEEAARRDFRPTKQAGDIFKVPNTIKSGVPHLDDTWTDWNKNYRILATTNSNKNIALATLKYGKGMYLVTAISNDTEQFVKDNAPLMENIIHYSVKQLKS